MGNSFDEKMFSLTNEARITAIALVDQKKTSDSLSEKISAINGRVLVVEERHNHFATKESLEKQKNHLIIACITAAVVVAGLAVRVFL